MTQKRQIYADRKDKIRMICENLRASDASALRLRSYRRAAASACIMRAWAVAEAGDIEGLRDLRCLGRASPGADRLIRK